MLQVQHLPSDFYIGPPGIRKTHIAIHTIKELRSNFTLYLLYILR